VKRTDRIPDFKLDLCPFDFDHARPEFHANGQIMCISELVLGELQAWRPQGDKEVTELLAGGRQSSVLVLGPAGPSTNTYDPPAGS
jgi:hypothetical protein